MHGPRGGRALRGRGPRGGKREASSPEAQGGERAPCSPGSGRDLPGGRTAEGGAGAAEGRPYPGAAGLGGGPTGGAGGDPPPPLTLPPPPPLTPSPNLPPAVRDEAGESLLLVVLSVRLLSW